MRQQEPARMSGTGRQERGWYAPEINQPLRPRGVEVRAAWRQTQTQPSTFQLAIEAYEEDVSQQDEPVDIVCISKGAVGEAFIQRQDGSELWVPQVGLRLADAFEYAVWAKRGEGQGVGLTIQESSYGWMVIDIAPGGAIACFNAATEVHREKVRAGDIIMEVINIMALHDDDDSTAVLDGLQAWGLEPNSSRMLRVLRALGPLLAESSSHLNFNLDEDSESDESNPFQPQLAALPSSSAGPNPFALAASSAVSSTASPEPEPLQRQGRWTSRRVSDEVNYAAAAAPHEAEEVEEPATATLTEIQAVHEALQRELMEQATAFEEYQ